MSVNSYCYFPLWKFSTAFTGSSDIPKECEFNSQGRQWRTFRGETSTVYPGKQNKGLSSTFQPSEEGRSVQQPKRCAKHGDKEEDNSPKNVNKVHNTSSQKYGQILFVGFSKAFDSLHKRKMERILLAYGRPKETITSIIILCLPDRDRDFFDIVAGNSQGDILALSARLFIHCWGDGFMHFPKETKSASSRIWTLFVVLIFYNDNRFTNRPA